MPDPAGYRTIGSQLTPIWTPRGFLARSQDFWVICECGHEAMAPFQAMIDAGDGDKVMAEGLRRLRCAACGSRKHHARLGPKPPSPYDSSVCDLP